MKIVFLTLIDFKSQSLQTDEEASDMEKISIFIHKEICWKGIQGTADYG